MSRTSTVLHVDTLSIEGGLFTSEWLAKVSAQQAAMQADADYGVRAGFNLREEIGFAWRSAQTLWRQFDQARQQPNADSWGISQHFATELLRQCFAFSLTKQALPIVIAERSYPVQFSALEGHVPIVISPHDEVKALDVAHDRLGDNSGERIRKRNAFGLLQESLNAMPDALWGIATNGLQLRIARDNASLTRPAWVEVDLERLFAEERYADFSVMWLLLHASRFGSAGSISTDCALEQWRNACREQGTRARETLRGGVEVALLELGQGFVSHPANTALRDALATGTLSSHEYLRELLRLVYRQIFLLTVEEREILHRNDVDPGAVALYADGYSLRRLRERAVRRSAHDRHGDLWQALKQVWIGLGVGEPLLALPPLGGLFESSQCPSLDACKLENRFLLSALFHLAWLRPEANSPLTRVNWRDMGPEELGSIYESLLELVPMLSNEHRKFGFHTGSATRGNARKTTGSYYTHDSLVQVQLDSALDPVISAALNTHPVGEEAVQALLAISVIDPACGSGHFLLAAARRIAGQLARVRAQTRDAELGNSGQPTPEDYRRALRDVVTHCVYGVDMNPMALELTRMALWLEAYTPDVPLGFIDHHFQLGNALLGIMDLKVILEGVPDDAYKTLTGDNNALCLDLKRRNRLERTGLEQMKAAANFSQSLQSMDFSSTAVPLQQLDALPDASLTDIAAKRLAYEELQKGAGNDGLALALHLYCAAYLLPKQATTEIDTVVPTTQDVMNALMGQPVAANKKEVALKIAKRTPFLHWKLAFSQVFARGGFSVILANPPWERLKLQEQEFFSDIAPSIADARNKSERNRAINSLSICPPGSPERQAYDDFTLAKRLAEATSLFCHGSRYPLTGVGDVNMYALFAETTLNLLHRKGRAGIIVQSDIALSDTCKIYFDHIVSENRIISLHDFINLEKLFPDIDTRNPRFCLLTLGTPETENSTVYSFGNTNTNHLTDKRRHFTISSSDLTLLNPNTRTCPTFKSSYDAQLVKRLYQNTQIFWEESNLDGNPWGIRFMRMFDMSNDSNVFKDATQKGDLSDLLPLYEAKMLHHFDHRWATYIGTDDESREMTDGEKINPNSSGLPRYWIERKAVSDRISNNNWNRDWVLGFRDITNSANERTVITCIAPLVGFGHKFPLILAANTSATLIAALYGNLASITLDYIARTKHGGTSLTYFYLKQFPILDPTVYTSDVLNTIIPRIAELTFTAENIRPFYNDLISENQNWDYRLDGERGTPWRWAPARRAILRAEIDAIYAKLYGLNREELSFILDPTDVMGLGYPSETFRVLKEREIRQFEEYRTRRLILEAWDKFNV